MSRATATLLDTVDAIDPEATADNDGVSAEAALRDVEPASADLVTWIDALALTLAPGLRVGAGFHRLPSPVAPAQPEAMDVEYERARTTGTLLLGGMRRRTQGNGRARDGRVVIAVVDPVGAMAIWAGRLRGERMACTARKYADREPKEYFGKLFLENLPGFSSPWSPPQT